MKPDTAQTCSADLSFQQTWARSTYQNRVERFRPQRIKPAAEHAVCESVFRIATVAKSVTAGTPPL